jgi:predicted transposase YbfD/YdcC
LNFASLATQPQEHAVITDVSEADLVSIIDFFGDLEDPRSTINRRHLLTDLMVICVAAVVAGCDGPKAIGIWAKSKTQWCTEHLRLPAGIPSHDTIGRVLATLNPKSFQACFSAWIAHVQRNDQSTLTTTQEQIAIDGKALRRSHDHRKGLGPLFLVSAWSVKGGFSLGQMATEAKSNETTAIPELIDNIMVQGAVVTIDAAGCQRNIAKKIVDAKGDYVLALKGNQGKMHQQAIDWIDQQFDNEWRGVVHEILETSEKGHGREDQHSYIQFLVPDEFKGRQKWEGLKTIGVAIRSSVAKGKETIDTRYYLNSLPLDVKRFATSVRGHWAIENSLHWCLDVTFREDESRLRNRFAAENIAWLKRFAIGLIKQNTSKESIAMQRRMAGWNDNYLSQLLGLPTL